MKKLIKTEHLLNAPADRVWSHIGRGDQVEAWLPIIADSRLEGSNRRFCEMKDGGKLEETILKSDDLRIFLYSIDKQTSFPVTAATGTIRLEEAGENQTRLYWDLEADLIEGAPEAVFAEQVEQIYAASAQQLEALAA